MANTKTTNQRPQLPSGFDAAAAAQATLLPHAMRYMNTRLSRREINSVTHTNQAIVLLCFSTSYGKRPVQNLSLTAVDRFMREKADISTASARSYLSVIRLFLRHLHQTKVIPRDIASEIHMPRKPRSIPITFDAGEPERVLAVCPDARGRALVGMTYFAALRCVEVSRLDVGDVDWRRSTIAIRGKFDHERVEPLSSAAVALLRTYLAEHPPRGQTGPVFRNYYHTADRLSPSTISNYIGCWTNQAGVKHHPGDGKSAHAFRRTRATEVLEATGDPRAVQELLGHSNLSAGQPYIAALGSEALRKAMERIDAAVR